MSSRPVWITREQRSMISAAASAFTPAVSDHLNAIVAAWDAAPVDAPEAVLNALPYEEWDDDYTTAIIRVVLAALGMPA